MTQAKMPRVKPITKHGNSAGIILEQAILKLLGWEVGTELETTVIPRLPPLPAPQPVIEHAPERSFSCSDEVLEQARREGLGLVLAGGVLILATIAEDILTVGGGLVDDPATVGAGALMIQQGLQAAH